MNDTNDDENKVKAKFYQKERLKVHLTLKSGRFYNGRIIDTSEDYLVIWDLKLGQMPIFYKELEPTGIEPYNEVGQ